MNVAPSPVVAASRQLAGAGAWGSAPCRPWPRSLPSCIWGWQRPQCECSTVQKREQQQLRVSAGKATDSDRRRNAPWRLQRANAPTESGRWKNENGKSACQSLWRKNTLPASAWGTFRRETKLNGSKKRTTDLDREVNMKTWWKKFRLHQRKKDVAVLRTRYVQT